MGRLPCAVAGILLSALCFGASGAGVLQVIDTGGIDAASLSTLRSLVAARLHQRGISLVDDPSKANRVFVFQPSRLGAKVILELEERDPQRGTVIYSVSLAAQSLEETDRIIPRLVDALIDRVSAEENAEIKTVTREEAEPFQKRPGEKFWVVGLPLGLSGAGVRGAFGLSIGWDYEIEHFRVGLNFLGAGSEHLGAFLAGIEASWLPLGGEWSPYLSPGVGYMYLLKDGLNGGGAGFSVEAGAEFFRLHSFRALIGVQTLLPAYELSSDTTSKWIPVFLLHVRAGF